MQSVQKHSQKPINLFLFLLLYLVQSELLAGFVPSEYLRQQNTKIQMKSCQYVLFCFVQKCSKCCKVIEHNLHFDGHWICMQWDRRFRAGTCRHGCIFIKREAVFSLRFMSLASFHQRLVWPCLLLMHSGKASRPLSQDKVGKEN